MSLGFAILLWLHIVSAVGWLGSGLVFGMLIAPTLPSLQPANRAELVIKLFPKYVRWITVFSLVTPIFGVTLMLYISHGSFSIFNPSNGPFSMFITVGALLTLVTWALAYGLIIPTTLKIVRLTKEAISGSGPPSPQLAKSSTRLRVSATVGLLLLLAVLYCMVAAATT